jgi:hypothetical protein
MIKFKTLADEIAFFRPSDELKVKVETFLDEKIVIIDNFYNDPYGIRELAQTIPSTRAPGIIHGLPGSRVEATYFFGHLGPTFKEIINTVWVNDVQNIEPTFIQDCLNRSSFLVNVQNSELPPRVPHIDNPSHGRWAVGIYLNTDDECSGGTSFYTFKGNKTVDLSNLDIELKEYQHYVQESDEHWTKQYLAEMKFNRLVIYKQNVLHTPYILPNTFTDESPRLIQMFFI